MKPNDLDPCEAHTLTMTNRRGRTLGWCSCGNYRFTGPTDMVEELHRAHLQYPNAKLTGSGSR